MPTEWPDSESEHEDEATAEVRVYDTVLLDEMDYDEDEATYYYQCPCGDLFEITKVRQN